MGRVEKLLLLHGFTGAPESWDAVRGELDPSVPVVAPPLTGHATAREDSVVGSFDDELDRILTLLGPAPEKSVLLAGYSLGARLALGLLLKQKRLFSGSVLIGVQPGLCADALRKQRLLADQRWVDLLAAQGVAAFAEAWGRQPLFDTQQRLPLRVLRAQSEVRRRHSAAGLIRALRLLGLGTMPCYTPRLGELDLPVVLLAGQRDEKFVRIARAMCEKLPRSELKIKKNAGHNLLLEAPSFVAQALRQGMNDD